MFVHHQTTSCNACGFDPKALSEIVDISIEGIKLDWSPVACECGYFYQERHYAVSFKKWQVAVLIAKGNIDYVEKQLSLITESKSAVTKARFEVLVDKNLKETLTFKQRLEELGSTPIPDHLFY